MGVFLGGVSSALYGVADFLGGEGSKRVGAPTVVFWAGIVSLPLITVVAVLAGGTVETSDWWLGGLGGATGALGLVALFTGLGRGHAAAVAPSAAAVGGVFPVIAAVLAGDDLSGLTWLGVAIAVPAIVLCAWVSAEGDVALGGLWYGVLAGVGFGGYTVLLDRTSEASGLLPLIPARASTMAVVAVLALGSVWKVTGLSTLPKSIVFGNGLLDVSGNAALLLALRSGDLAPVAVAASFYPAVTVLMARIVNSEILRTRQVVGLALTVVALAVISLG